MYLYIYIIVNCAIMVIIIGEEKQEEYNTEILRGSIVYLHPLEQWLKTISLSLK